MIITDKACAKYDLQRYTESSSKYGKEIKISEQKCISKDSFEGIWNASRGGQAGQVQIIIRAKGMQAIINKTTGEIIDFYTGTSLDGFIKIRKVQ